MEMRVVARRSLTSAVELLPGQTIKREHISILRPASGIAPKHLDAIIGKKVKRAVEPGTPLQWSDIENGDNPNA